MRLQVAVVAVLAVGCQLFAANAVGAQDARAVATDGDAMQIAARQALGQRIYREGSGASGQPLKALGAAQTALSGKDVACATCHRRSGFGSSEGRFVVRPIIGPALRQERAAAMPNARGQARLGAAQRPAYTDALLARAIRSGLDAAGKPLDGVMPRYTLSDDETAALAAYLFSLSATPSPGVDEQEIHFATVIQPGVAPERRRAMLDVMQAFVKDKGANVRQDEQRREAGNMRMYRAYRKWVLHVWDLSGPSATWGAQLEAHQRQQPVFALIGGLGAASWAPIHAFSERMEIPSVFPQADLPVLSGLNNYTFYFSRGAVLEAQVLAKFLREQGDSGTIVQVYRREDGGAGAVAAAAFRAALAPGTVLEDQVLDGPANDAFWRRMHGTSAGALVLWLGAQDLAGVQTQDGSATPVLYLSSQLLSGRLPQALNGAGANVRLLYPSDLPPQRDARLLRNKLWLHSKGIAITDEVVQMNTQFTLAVVNDVVGHIMDSFSRDYFVERVEHAVGQTPTASVFQNVSLGPGQRFAAKGSSVVQLPHADNPQMKPLSGWIVP